MNDKQASRLEFRVLLFSRRGWPETKAREWADKLTERDASRDDRRLCIECKGLMRTGGCFPAKQGRLPDAISRDFFTPVTDILQRCAGFAWQTT